MKKRIHTGTGTVDKDYRGEDGVVMFYHSVEDLPIKMVGRTVQLILERIKTPDVQNIKKLNETIRGGKGFGSTGVKDSVKNQSKD